ncbi:MAG: hypothetical protein GWP06_09080 [Actinobacteria bacterium]|nr:hypothetical protein [Actinomycetota bacterium]
MANLAEMLEQDLEEAFEVKDKKSLHRFVASLTENIVQKSAFDQHITELKSDVKILAETMKKGFEAIDKRFEAVDKRFEDLYRYMDKRFESVDKRFEDMNSRFEDMNKRFEDMGKRFNMMFTFMNLGFGIIILLTILFKFLQ